MKKKNCYILIIYFCIDICEDAELRERIIQLRSEQETKRAAEAQRRRVRRSQSNTRTQSVRRTSIRDKTLTSKKDAQEEARLRLQAQEASGTFISFMQCVSCQVLQVLKLIFILSPGFHSACRQC